MNSVTALLSVLLALAPQTPALTDPRQILVARQERQRSQSEEALVDLIVTSANGSVRKKQWRNYREGSGAAANRLIRFLAPADVRGVGYLLRQRPGRTPDEWLYLPSMKRERRIVASDRQQAFVGTDFTYEDLEEFDEAVYDLKMLPDRTVEGRPAYAISLTPRTRSAYDRKVLVIRKDDLALLLVEYYRKGDSTISKRLTLSDYREIQGQAIALKLEMADVRKGSRTTLLVHDVVLNRPQPADRYTIENLLREDGESLPPRPRASFYENRKMTPEVLSDAPPLRLGGRFTGFAEAKLIGYLAVAGPRDVWAEAWTDVVASYAGRIGPVRVRATGRAELTTSARAGPLAFDPADRALDRAPLSIRELSALFPLFPGVGLQVGRFRVVWAQTDAFSPADAFFPRDLSDPLTDERLPVWAAELRGEFRRLRFDVLVVPLTTPWRLPDLTGRHSPLAFAEVYFTDVPSDVPRKGFQAAHVSTTVGSWDVAAWARSGVRPAPIFQVDKTYTELPPPGTEIPLRRRYATETGGGIQLAHEYIGWLVQGELAVTRSPDPDLRHAVIWSTTLSHSVRQGTFSGTFAMNGVKAPADKLRQLDRALLPAFVLALRQTEPWGSWKINWLGTFDQVAGVLAAEATRSLTESLQLITGVDLPHGAPLSPARAFAGGKRLRLGIRVNW